MHKYNKDRPQTVNNPSKSLSWHGLTLQLFELGTFCLGLLDVLQELLLTILQALLHAEHKQPHLFNERLAWLRVARRRGIERCLQFRDRTRSRVAARGDGARGRDVKVVLLRVMFRLSVCVEQLHTPASLDLPASRVDFRELFRAVFD